MSKLNVTVGNDFPLDGDVVNGNCHHHHKHHGHDHDHHGAHGVCGEHRALRAEFKQAWREKFHSLHHCIKAGEGGHHA